ncbi:MAG: hypothetical protein GF307_06640 [candidate division Zixibacteria bacterium]|nr:hypothetical protein [candidate division Zixibacteria bacterium]
MPMKTNINTLLSITVIIAAFTIINCGNPNDGGQSIVTKAYDNGLTVIVKEDHKAPLFAMDTWVMTGYFNEHDSIVGISHLLEHMFFKGTEKRAVGQLRIDTKSLGARFNAGTSYEHTHYYTVAPSNRLMESLEIQSDALRNSSFDSAELEKEAMVVIQEVKRKYDNPERYGYEMMFDLMFDTHRMGRWRMGTPEEVAAFTRDELLDYYHKHYTPDNTIIAVVGDVNAEEVFAGIEKYYGDWHPDSAVIDFSNPEPEQEGLRRRIMYSDLKQPYIFMGYKTPGFLEKEAAVFDVLSFILATGKESRLYRRLIDELHLAGYVECEQYSLKDHGVFHIEVHAVNDEITRIEREVISELRSIMDYGVTEYEMQRAINNLQSKYLFGREKAANMAEVLAMFEQYGGYGYADEYLRIIGNVTIADLKQAVSKYLPVSKCSIIEYMPKVMKREEIEPEVYSALLTEKIEAQPPEVEEHGSQLASLREYTDREDLPAVSYTLPNGITIVVKENHSLPLVNLRAGIKGGRYYENEGNCGITRLTANCMINGSQKYPGDILSGMIESAGGSLSSFAEPDYFGFSLSIPSRYFVSSLDVVAELIMNPEFDEDKFESEQVKQLAGIEKNKDSMRSYPLDLMYAALYPDHPYGLPEYGTESAVSGIYREDMEKWYSDFKMGKNIFIVIAGDVDREEIKRKVEELMGGIKQQRETSLPGIAPPPSPGSAKIVKRDKSQSAQSIGFRTCERGSDDYYPLKILQNIASGMGGRLFVELRDKRSLAYTVYGYNTSFENSGAFVCYIATNPGNEFTARKGLLRELYRFKDEYVGDKELEIAKAYLSGRYAEALETNSGQAYQYLAQAIIGNGMGEVNAYPVKAATVDKKAIMEVAKKYFEDDAMAYGVVRGK